MSKQSDTDDVNRLRRWILFQINSFSPQHDHHYFQLETGLEEYMKEFHHEEEKQEIIHSLSEQQSLKSNTATGTSVGISNNQEGSNGGGGGALDSTSSNNNHDEKRLLLNKKIKTQVGVDDLAISKSSEYSLFDWFNYWFRGITLNVSTFGAVSNPHKYIEKQGDLLPDRLSHDFYSRIYRFNKEEYVDAIANAKDDGHAPLTHNYEDCMQNKRGLSIFGLYTGGIYGSAFAFAKNFGTITNRKRYVPYTLCGMAIGFTLFRFVISPRTESCFEQIINQALSERIISKGYDNMMEYYRHNEKPKIVNWNDYDLDKEQEDYLNTRMRQHMLNAMKKAGCNKESIESFKEGNEIEWKQHLDSNFKREYPSHRKYFKFL